MTGKRKMPLKQRIFTSSGGGVRPLIAMISAVALLFTYIGLVGAPAQATGSGGGNQECTWEWKREIPQSHQEYKYKKKITKTKYQYQKETHTKVKHGHGGWEPYGDWSWWSPPSYQWSFDDVEVLEGPAPHGSGTTQHGDHVDQWYREYRYVQNGATEEVDTGEYEYSGWTTEVRTAPWVKIDERTVPGESIVQGPVRSVGEPDRGDYPNVPWTKVPGSQVCPEKKMSICHATGSESNPFVLIADLAISGVYNGHLGQGHQNGEDIIPPFEYQGQTYSQNWDAEGQAVFNNGCEIPEKPPTVVPVPEQGSNDPCNPHGVTNNVDWKGPLPADSNTVDWSESNNGATRTATLVGDNVEWSDGTTAPKVFNLPADSGEKCPPTQIEIPATPTSSDLCGPNNATWNQPADTEMLNWELLDNGHLVVTIVPEDVVFTDGTTSHDFGTAPDSNEPCPPGEVTPVIFSVNGPTCATDGTLVIPGQPEGVLVTPAPGTYGPGTYDVVYTAEDGVVLSNDPSGEVKVLAATGYQDEDESAVCYVDRKPEKTVDRDKVESCKLGGVLTTYTVSKTTWSFNENTQKWESNVTGTSSQRFDAYTRAELVAKGCITVITTPNPPTHPTNPPHAGGSSGGSNNAGMLGLSGLALLLAGLTLITRRRAGERV